MSPVPWFLFGAALSISAFAAPNAGDVQERGLRSCWSGDTYYQALTNPSNTAQASSYCSRFVRSTELRGPTTTTQTTTVTVQPSQVKRDVMTTSVAGLIKRDQLDDLAAADRAHMSSACSCIITSVPSPTTIDLVTRVAIQTVTKTADCRDTLPALSILNDFEPGNVANWKLLSPPDVSYTFNASSPGYQSNFALTVTTFGPYELGDFVIGQTIPTCPGAPYYVGAKVFLSDNNSMSGRYPVLQLFADDQQLDIGNIPDLRIVGPPREWTPFYALFDAKKSKTTIKIRFNTGFATSPLAQCGFDDINVHRVGP